MKKKAFTLIELLVTIVLFSLLLMTALYSFRFISLNIKNINNTNPQKAINYDLVRNVIGSLYYYVAVDKKEMALNKRTYHYFEGKEKECFFITMSPLYSTGLAMVHLKYEDSKLWYEEGKLFTKGVDYMSLNNIPLSHKFIILDNIKDVVFSYRVGQKNRQNISRHIPEMISLKIEEEQKKKRYIFKIKSNNYKNITSIRVSDAER